LTTWAIILITLIAQIGVVAWFKSSRADNEAQLLFAGRYTVGVQRLLQALPAGQALNRQADTDKLLASVDRAATSPAGRLEAAIVHGELQGRQAVLDRLDALDGIYPSLRGDIRSFRALYNDELPPDSPEWRDLLDRYGWFAQLAAGNDKPPGDPHRTAALHAAMRTMVGSIIIFGVSLLAGVAGLILFILAMVFFAKGKVGREFNVDAPPDRSRYIEAFAVYLVGMAGLGAFFRYVLRLDLPWPYAALPIAFFAAIAWPLLRGQSVSQWRNAVGLYAGRGIVREIFAGIVGYLAGLPVVLLGVIITIILVRVSGADASHPITREFAGGPSAWLMAFLLASVWAPITEELLFRGALFAHLRERFGWWVSALIVSLIFASIHPQGWAAIPALAAVAIVLAAIREWRGSILGCITAHAVHNTTLLLIAILVLG
jgi:membrane protease YdiL (CAAX protease family)